MKNHAQRSQGIDDLSSVAMSLSRADMELSRADMELFKAEVSAGRSEAIIAKVTFALFMLPLGYGLALIILALREEYVHKKFLKSQTKA